MKSRVLPLTCFLLTVLTTMASAQKIKVGYDKSVDFSKYKTYQLEKPGTVTRPLLYASVVGTIEQELEAKGMTGAGAESDLILLAAGGINVSANLAAGDPILSTFTGPVPTMNATMWTGVLGLSNRSAMHVPEGTLMLQFVDRHTNQVIWTGTVVDKLDLERKGESLERVNKSVAKLLKKYPPKGSQK